MRKYSFIVLFTSLGMNFLSAQATLLPNEGKMMTTVLVLAAVLIGIFVFLFILERRLKKLENQIKDES